MSDEINLLHPLLHKWMYKKGFKELRHIQKEAIKPILEHKKDVIVSASTAAGKTEAVFFPIITYLSQHKKEGLRVLCILPLRALINDQAKRIDDMLYDFNYKITPWHSDVSQSIKDKFIKKNTEILMITPESLESLLMRLEPWFREAIQTIDYFVIDEYHAFMGNSRGIQLQSQLYRIENLAKKNIVRVAISATFSDLSYVASDLRYGANLDNFAFITPDSNSKTTLNVQLRGYKSSSLEDVNDFGQLTAYESMTDDIFRLLRGSTNLVFTNSRSVSESISAFLKRKSDELNVPNEFFPHHGSLSKETRSDLEYRLQNARLPTTAICTATLELGIDISDVSSVFQIDEPLSVSALRQRVGRSGRRDGNPILRVLVVEEDHINSKEKDYSLRGLCEKTISSMAVISLLLHKWYEPSDNTHFSLSTLIQQILSVIISNNGATASLLYKLLCKKGAFQDVSPEIFAEVLKDLASKGIIRQMQSGELILDLDGEKLCENFEFLSTFINIPDYVVEHNNSIVGRIPYTKYPKIEIGSSFILSGKSWVVTFINDKKKIVGVKPYNKAAPSLSFSGTVGALKTAVREEMYKIYTTGSYLPCANKIAIENIQRGINTFKMLELDKRSFIENASGIALFPWLGDKELETIKIMLKRKYINCQIVHSHIEINAVSLSNLKSAIASILYEKNIDAVDLLSDYENLDADKYDYLLSTKLKKIAFARTNLKVDAALNYFMKLSKEL